MKKVICILSDAHCYDYSKKFDLEFLKSIDSKNIVKKVIPSTGYCEIVEYVTGQNSIEHNMLTQVNAIEDWYKIKPSFFYKVITCIFDNKLWKLPKFKGFHNKYLYRIISYILKFYLNDTLINVRYNIPLRKLPFLKAIESIYDYDSIDFGGNNNLFRKLLELNCDYDIQDYVYHNKVKGSDIDRLNRLLNKIKTKKLRDFTLIYVGYGEIAHIVGKEDDLFRTKFVQYDKLLQEIYHAISQNYKDYDLLILGDHGMINVHNYVDAKKIISDTFNNLLPELKIYEDYFYFIDSTMIRIWLKNKQNIKLLKSIFLENLGNYIESDTSTFEYLDNFTPEYGDLIFLLKPHTVYYPDYYNISKVKGMHGYLNHYNDQHGVMFHLSSDENLNLKAIKSLELSELNSYIYNLFK